jgi:hypothetical protein
MDNWMTNKMDDVDRLHVEIDNLNNPLVGFCVIRDIDIVGGKEHKVEHVPRNYGKLFIYSKFH